ncbi:MAG: DegT/DnrJ/EryC1/StrS family aminotransferase, partial [Deltaproteobacteria bacterium]|nr:DegT/DnrJ/EryC1/StrS family aminotransferase [Deltaproteobacteria bacterium]
RECGAKHCVAVANGTLALHLACLALEVGPGDVGLTSPITFLASANCIAYCGGRPDFEDIDPSTLCLSPARVDAYCRTKGVPKVVIPVDFAGVPADLPGFKALSEKYGFHVIEDAAHSLGSTYEFEGRTYRCGSCAHTDLAILSFHPVKTITTGEGGALLTNDDALAAKLRRLSSHGVERDPSRFVHDPCSNLEPRTSSRRPWYHEMQDLGFNARITDIQCALGLSQLRRLGAFKARRRELVRLYDDAFGDLAEKGMVILPPRPEGTDPCSHLYTLRIGPNCTKGRDELFNKLREEGIYCQVHYIPIYRQPFYQRRYPCAASSFPESERYFRHCISLPLFHEMDEKDFTRVVGRLQALLQGRPL